MPTNVLLLNTLKLKRNAFPPYGLALINTFLKENGSSPRFMTWILSRGTITARGKRGDWEGIGSLMKKAVNPEA